MRHAIHRVGAAPRAGAVTDAIGIAAQERAATGYALGRAGRHSAVVRVEAVGRPGGVHGRLAVLRLDLEGVGAVPVGRPLPDVACHVVKPVAVGREAADGHGAHLHFFILHNRKRLRLLRVPDIGHRLALG
ncbi:hypothetical protein D3C71_1769990 [compost metagenome]